MRRIGSGQHNDGVLAMAGTDRSRDAVIGGPAIILVRPQMGENIGTAARAMLNFGLTDLRLVEPRDGWPNIKAINAAARATDVLDNVRLFDTTAEAVADLRHVFATTARPRFMLKPTKSPQEAAVNMRHWQSLDEPCGILFGRERTGLGNGDVVLADTVLTVPINPAYASLNLAQAVLLVGYEWFQAGDTEAIEVGDSAGKADRMVPATRDDIENFFVRLERELDACGFLRNEHKRSAMVRNIRNIFLRAGLFDKEVNTLHGIISELVKGRSEDGDG